jgi:AAA ATPase domain
MADRYNPFRPNSIVSTGMFAGRYEELKKIRQAFVQTRNGNPAHFLIHGERGIGKSSLLLYVNALGNGRVLTPSGEAYNFLTLQIELESSDTPTTLIEKIVRELRREVSNRDVANALIKKGWDIVKRLEAFGVKLRDEKEVKKNHLMEDLIDAIDEVLSKIGVASDGILLLIDEADRGATNVKLGSFVKLLTERLTKRNCLKFCLGLAGLTEMLPALKKSHESSLRIFNVMELEPLLDSERWYVISLGLNDANNVSGTVTSIANDAADALMHLSEGYPHFIQQFAFCAFEVHTDQQITLADVQKGAHDPEHGAIAQLGHRYFQDLYFGQIASNDYRKVLHAMASDSDGWVTKKQIHDRTGLKASTINNAIHALKSKGLIRPQKGKQGVYKLPSRSFAVWIRAFTADLTHPTEAQ